LLFMCLPVPTFVPTLCRCVTGDSRHERPVSGFKGGFPSHLNADCMGCFPNRPKCGFCGNRKRVPPVVRVVVGPNFSPTPYIARLAWGHAVTRKIVALSRA